MPRKAKPTHLIAPPDMDRANMASTDALLHELAVLSYRVAFDPSVRVHRSWQYPPAPDPTESGCHCMSILGRSKATQRRCRRMKIRRYALKRAFARLLSHTNLASLSGANWLFNSI